MHMKYSSKSVQISSFLFHKGLALARLGDHRDAIEAFKKTADILPSFAPAWYNKGKSLNQSGKYSDAISAFTRALEIDSSFTEVYYHLGFALFSLEKYTEAIESFDKNLEKDTGNAQGHLTVVSHFPGSEDSKKHLRLLIKHLFTILIMHWLSIIRARLTWVRTVTMRQSLLSKRRFTKTELCRSTDAKRHRPVSS